MIASADDPELLLPKPLYGREPDTWQYLTITERLADTAARVLAEGDWSSGQATRLQQLMSELPDGPIRALNDPQAPDAADWTGYVAPYTGHSWLDVPWFFAEMYFFRRILEATGYFGPGVGEGVDPYAYQKAAGLEMALPAVPALVAQFVGGHSSDTLRRLLVQDLWGNQADLSIWPASSQPGSRQGVLTTPDRAHLLIDQILQAVHYLETARAQLPLRVDFLADNVGIELIGDLITADFLLQHGIARSVHIHVKPYPTFVSDATIPDVAVTIEALTTSSGKSTAVLGSRLRRALADGRLRVQPHIFWTSPNPFWELPADIRSDLQASNLIISKGDMNYRRLHGDRHWPFDTDFAAIVQSSPAPILALRVVKAEVASGMSADLIAATQAKDPDWMTSGRWGMAPFSR